MQIIGNEFAQPSGSGGNAVASGFSGFVGHRVGEHYRLRQCCPGKRRILGKSFEAKSDTKSSWIPVYRSFG